MRAVRREHWRALVALAGVAFVASVVPLVSAAGARRTASSLHRMQAELEPYDLDLQLDAGPPPPGFLHTLRGLPGVAAAAEGASILARPVGTDLEPFESFGQGGKDSTLGHDFERPRLTEGRLPRAADEVFVSTRLARQAHLAVGGVLRLETFTPGTVQRIFAGEVADYDGPVIELRVVGVGHQPEELTGGADYPVPLFVVAPAFFPKWEGRIHWFDGIYLVRLTGGADGIDAFTAALHEVLPGRDDLTISPSEQASRVGDAVSTQATALALLALVAAVTGGLAIAQAVARVSRSVMRDTDVLAAIGFTRWDAQVATGAAVIGPVVLGVATATATAALASGIFPTGPAGKVEPDPGLRVDWLALGGVAALLLGGALVSAMRRRRARPHAPATPSRLGGAAARVAPSVAVAAGIGAALRPGRGPSSIPSRSAMVALGAGVAGLVAALVFGTSLDRLVHEPARYGWSFDYQVALGDGLSDEAAIVQARTALDDRRIGAALYVRTSTRELGGRSTVVMGVEPLTGEVPTTIVKGRDVRADDEVVLGQTTLELLHQHVGGTIPLDGADGPRALRIVGQGLFPSNENEDPAAGAVVSLATLHRLPGTDGYPGLYVTLAPGASARSVVHRLESTLGFATGPVPPPAIANLQLVDQSPYLLAAYLAVLGAVVSAHAVLMIIRQRRAELATLKTLGFARRQVATTVLTQSVAIAVVGTLAGIPLGLAAGRLAWRLVAGGLGFAVDPKNPVPLLATVPLGAVVLAVLVAAAPAWWVARARPAVALRTE
jgi:hypothetical protein